MKHLVAIALGLLSLIGIYFFVQYSSEPQIFTNHVSSSPPMPTRTIVQGESQKMLFIPYWGLGGAPFPSGYDQLIYFGITPSTNGIDTSEQGYKNLTVFNRLAAKQDKKLLAIRMIDQSMNIKVLQDKNLQQEIIAQSLALAKQYHFSGVVLDLEYSALSFDSVIKSITNFSTQFAKSSHQNGLNFYQTVYGDTYYRLRPFDPTSLAKNADGIIVLAYDFHKANGDPGANFPLSGKQTQGYDLKSMIDDFAGKMPTQKIIVTFGFFGYDWILDAKGHSSGQATALSLMQIQQKFLTNCPYIACSIARDAPSGEMHITYTDEEKKKHSVWFEDMQSAAQKTEYLHTQGINATAVWAYSYY